MNEEIILDFFRLVSADKFVVSSKDIDNFEIFITKPEFEDIYESLNEFLNDFIYWCVQKLELNVNLIDEGQINLNAINKLKKNETDKKNRSNSYKMLYKRNLEFKKIKSTETKKSIRNLIKYKNIVIQIPFEIVKNYFDENSTYNELVLKFLTRMQTIIINHQLLIRQTSLNDLSKNKSRKKKKVKKKINKNIYTEKTEDKSFKTEDCRIEQINKSDNENVTGEDASKDNSGKCLSDNEMIMKTKVNFLKVLKDVTKNIINEKIKEGKDITIIIESDLNDIIVDKNKEEKSIIEISNKNEDKANKITFNNEEAPIISDKNIQVQVKPEMPLLKETEIKIDLVEDKKDECKITNKETDQNKASNLNTNVNTNIVVKEGEKDNKSKKKKESCKCNCIIF